MCGIVGVYAHNRVGKFYFTRLTSATQTLVHRGKNSSNTFVDHRIGFGHTRLAIIDLNANAGQPMHDLHRHYTIVYNGEIYNYSTLRKYLCSLGYNFQTQSDTEVALGMYQHHQENAFSQFNGFFATGIYEHQTETLCLARDPYGIKPLYYYHDENVFLFASELRALIAFQITKELNTTAAHFYFRLNYIPAPLTILKNTYQLEPGHYLKIQKNTCIKEKYETPQALVSSPKLSFSQAQSQLKKYLQTAVKERLMAEVPLGTFLSGGIDSSLITAFTRKYQNPLHTFHITYPDAPQFNEAPYASQVSNFLQTQHHSIPLHSHNIEYFAKKWLAHIDHPFADASAISMYALCEYAQQYVTVTLAGDGADELLAGYQKHKGFLMAQRLKIAQILATPFKNILYHLPKNRHRIAENYLRKLYRLLELFGKNTKEQYWYLASVLNDIDFNTMFLHHQETHTQYERYKAKYLSELHHCADLTQFLLLDLHFLLPNDMLYKVDITSMANTMEVRVPFLAPSVVNFAKGLPLKYLFHKGQGKYILRTLAYQMIPRHKLQPLKHGFDTPLHLLLQNRFLNWVQKNLLDENVIASQGLWRMSFIRQLKQEIHRRQRYDPRFLWAFIVFQYWWRKYM